MYETFYGLKERPFSLLPDPDYLYLSPKHLRALTLLEYGMMNHAGFSVICGDTGAGKTTLIRRLLTELGEDTTVGLITNTHKSFGELLSWVLMAFGIDGEGKSKAQMHQLLIEFLITQYAQNRHTVLIVDEAQNMTADQLEELRMLSNINADKDQVLQVILAGQPALRETLRKPELMQFAQRIAVDYYLESLNRDETQEYIRHRLEVAGGNPDTFTEAACHAVFRYSHGTPRLINLLCDTALVYAFAEQSHVIDANLIEDVVREQHKNSILSTFSKTAADTVPVASTAAVEAEDRAAISQKAASDYAAAINLGHAEVHHTPAPVADKVIPVMDSPQSTPADETAHAKVTRIKKTAAKKPETASNHEPQPGQDNLAAAVAAAKPAAGDSRQRTEAPTDRTESAEPVESRTESARNPEHTESSSHYKDLYPIVHIAEEEPKKNTNLLILVFTGGMALASAVMFAATWMMFNRDPVPASTTPATTVLTPPPAVPADEQARLDALQRERDAALAAIEAAQRERDAALAEAQKQEAIRAAEKRASEILAEQERRYSREMEQVRQRALQAEIDAAKARERERLAEVEAERARLEAVRASQQAAAMVARPEPEHPTAAPAPTPAAPVVVAEPKPAPVATPKKDDTQFSANPCNSPSAKFLSTCKNSTPPRGLGGPLPGIGNSSQMTC